MPKADLHLHTNRSDGLFSPEELVVQSLRRNLAAIAITDHDSVEGIPEGLEAGNAHNIEVIPGIEFSTNIDRGELHILGYFIDFHNRNLIEFIRRLKTTRHNRVKLMVEKLQNQGLGITLQQVLSGIEGNTSIGRPHIARALVQSGCVSSIKEAFEKYIGCMCPAYVERYKLTPREAVHIIKEYGGVPVLAHPGTLNTLSSISICIDAGIQGIEVYHSRHTRQQSEHFQAIAAAHGLIATGGSDCHGEYSPDGELLLGQITVDYNVVEMLKNKAAQNRKRRA